MAHTPDQLSARLDFIRSQPGFDDRPFPVHYSLANLNVGVAHAINDDPNAQFGQTAQQVIDNCGMLAGLGVTDTWVTPPPVHDLNAYLEHLHRVGAGGKRPVRVTAARQHGVIKVERVGEGDFARHYDAEVRGMASHFV